MAGDASRQWLRLVRLVGSGLLATLVGLGVLEMVIRVGYVVRNSLVSHVALPYVIGHSHGPVAPWIDGFRILEPDPVLLWKGKPNVRRRYLDFFSPARTEAERTAVLRRFLPNSRTAGGSAWEVWLNSEGFRDVEFPTRKQSSVFRILCLGDSWTFGNNVDQHQTYPHRLKLRLVENFPGADFEVFNLGVLGYTSLQGLELLRRRALALEPDMVVIGYAMNDSSVPGWRDRDLPGHRGSASWMTNAAALLEQVELYKLLRYVAVLTTYQAPSVGEHLRAKSAAPAEAADYQAFEPWTRVPLPEYEANIGAVIELARAHGAGIILLYNELWQDGPYRHALERVAQAAAVPLVDSSALIARARARTEAALEAELDLQPPVGRRRSADNVDVVFRVYVGRHYVPGAMFIAGTDPALGDRMPNRVRMYDDGTHGDQKAGDGVWSYTARVRPGARLFYVFTNSGREGAWEGLDVPDIRGVEIPANVSSEPVYQPVASFGTLVMQADPWHTNDVGYDLIADAILAKLQENDRVKRYLNRMGIRSPLAQGRSASVIW